MGDQLVHRAVNAGGLKVSSVPTQMAAADRARWLADVSTALNEAHHILATLSLPDEDYPLAMDLHIRIEAARFEVRTLRLSRSSQLRDELSPKMDRVYGGMIKCPLKRRPAHPLRR